MFNYFIFLIFLIFSRICCFQFMNNGVNINFKISNFKTCADVPASLKILTVPNFSLNDCVSSCAFRPTCDGLNYKKKFLLCELYNGENIQGYVGNCVNIKRSDIIAVSFEPSSSTTTKTATILIIIRMSRRRKRISRKKKMMIMAIIMKMKSKKFIFF